MLNNYKTVQFLREQAKEQSKSILTSALLAGLCQGLLVAVLGMAVDQVVEGETPIRLFFLFALCMGGFYFFYRFTVAKSTAVALEALGVQKLRIANKIRKMSLTQYEKLDKGPVYTLLSDTNEIIVEAARQLPVLISDSLMVILASLYALSLSVKGYLLSLLIMFLSGVVLLGIFRAAMSKILEAQEGEKKFTSGLRDLLYGLPDLKNNTKRADEVVSKVLYGRMLHMFQSRMRVEFEHSKGMAYFAFFMFLPCAGLVFILPGWVDLPLRDLFKLFAATMFSLNPLLGFVRFSPILNKAEASLSSVLAFEEELDAKLEGDEIGHPYPTPDFERITIQDADYQYDNGNGNGFALHVDDFHLQQGELVILCGGNGSGKSTFMKVLAGQYPLKRGHVRLNGAPTEEVGVQRYRELFSIIRADFHLFERIYGVDNLEQERVEELIKEMRLSSRVRLEGDRFSTTDLSTGQRKRLALICACLEDRPIMLFDEVAADFDPEFRTYFYRTLLPKLISQGKTILAISHDDRYFDVADRVVTMREGAMESVESEERE